MHLKKYQVYVIVGIGMIVLLPVYRPFHAAGFGILAAGVIDWIYALIKRNHE